MLNEKTFKMYFLCFELKYISHVYLHFYDSLYYPIFLSGMTDSTMSGYVCHTEQAEDVTGSKKQKVSWGQALKSV